MTYAEQQTSSKKNTAAQVSNPLYLLLLMLLIYITFVKQLITLMSGLICWK
jgi:hypothetical protein